MLLREQEVVILKKRLLRDRVRGHLGMRNGIILNILFLPNDIYEISSSTIKWRRSDKLPDCSFSYVVAHREYPSFKRTK